MSTRLRIVAIIALFLLKFLFGVLLTRSGKPYSVVMLALHKIISLLTVVLIGMTVYNLRRDVGLIAVEVGAIIVTGLLFVLTIATGGLLSTDKPAHAAITIVHRVVPFLAVLFTAVTIYLVA